jgi:hypothetical protein
VGSPTEVEAVRLADIEAVYAVRDDAERNRLITETYCNLSRGMRTLIGAHASWCTFSTWSSRTVGYFIRGDIDPLLDYRLSRLPRGLRGIVRGPVKLLNRSVSGMRKHAAPRLLARGNREIFVEIAGQFATFITTFSGATARDDRRWQQYRAAIVPSAPTELFRPRTSTSCATAWSRTTRRCSRPTCGAGPSSCCAATSCSPTTSSNESTPSCAAR